MNIFLRFNFVCIVYYHTKVFILHFAVCCFHPYILYHAGTDMTEFGILYFSVKL